MAGRIKIAEAESRISMRRRLAVSVGALVLIALGTAYLRNILFEPSFRGRSLGEWLVAFDNPEREARTEAAAALRHMGSPAAPFLADRLRSRIPSWKLALQRLLARQSIIRFHFGSSQLSEADMTRQRTRVFAACDALGPEAAGAVPALEEVLYKYREFDAAFALARVGDKATPALMRAAASKDYFVRICGAYFLESLRRGADLGSGDEAGVDFFRRARDQERSMLSIWLPKAVPFLPGPWESAKP